jgi:hypothetical protein
MARMSRGIAPHLGGHQPMRTHPMSHIVVDFHKSASEDLLSLESYSARNPMLRQTALLSALVVLAPCGHAQIERSSQPVPVEIVATASEYIPKTTTISHPGHAYTDCHGTTSYLGDFRGFEDSHGRISGDVSGTANTDTRCNTTFTPPTETSLTHYDRVNFTVARNGQTLYLLACTQKWTLSRKERLLAGLAAGAAGGTGDSSGEASSGISQNARGT